MAGVSAPLTTGVAWIIRTGMVQMLHKALAREAVSWLLVAPRCAARIKAIELHEGAVLKPDLEDASESVD